MKLVKKILSGRELVILDLVAKGHTSEKIALLLAIAKTTVQTHRRNMLAKTGCTNTQELVALAYRKRMLH